MNVGIVSPGYPETPGGVTDHTARLVRHWTEWGHEVDVLGSTAEVPRETVARWKHRAISAVLIQYVPFLYGRRGLSRFPRRLAVQARHSGIRVAAFVHEPWVPRTRLPWLVLSPLQRRQLLRLLGVCDAAFTPVPAWKALLGGTPHVVYVGSTLGDPPTGAFAEPPLPAPVVFSPFASGLRWDWIVAAVRAIASAPGLTVIGADWEAARRHRAVARWADPSWDWRGFLDPQAVHMLLSRARIVLAPFLDGLTGRRTSAFAAASVGAWVISSRGPLFDRAFEHAPFALANTPEEFRDLAVASWHATDPQPDRAGRIAWYQREAQPRRWDRELLKLLRGAR